MVVKFIKRDGKKFYGVSGGLKEATVDNIEIDLETQRRFVLDLEEIHSRHKRELMRLERVRKEIFKIKFVKHAEGEKE